MREIAVYSREAALDEDASAGVAVAFDFCLSRAVVEKLVCPYRGIAAKAEIVLEEKGSCVMAGKPVYYRQYTTARSQIDRDAELAVCDMVVEGVIYSLPDTAAGEWVLGQLFPENVA